VKPEPVTVTVEPTGPAAGEKLAIDAAPVTVKLVADTRSVPVLDFTWIAPVAAPFGTVNVIDVLLTTV
jgi:hypothetical protein